MSPLLTPEEYELQHILDIDCFDYAAPCNLDEPINWFAWSIAACWILFYLWLYILYVRERRRRARMD